MNNILSKNTGQNAVANQVSDHGNPHQLAVLYCSKSVQPAPSCSVAAQFHGRLSLQEQKGHSNLFKKMTDHKTASVKQNQTANQLMVSMPSTTSTPTIARPLATSATTIATLAISTPAVRPTPATRDNTATTSASSITPFPPCPTTCITPHDTSVTRVPFALTTPTTPDRLLYRKCVMLGRQSLKARRRFLGLLPEVYKRRLFERKGFGSIHEFAARLAGVSREQVDRVLRLERRLATLPTMRTALLEGKISANKLVRIVPLATVETEADLARKAELLSNRALEVMVRDMKNRCGAPAAVPGTVRGEAQGGLLSASRMKIIIKDARNPLGNDGGRREASSLSVGDPGHAADLFRESLVNNNGSDKPPKKDESVHVHTSGKSRGQEDRSTKEEKSLRLDADVAAELFSLQEKGIDINALLRKNLQEREAKIAREKAELGERQKREHEERAVIGKPASRYVPVAIRRVIREEYGVLCGVEGCHKRAKTLHHQRRFAHTQSHDPRFLKPLCAEHHQLEHLEDEVVQRFRLMASDEKHSSLLAPSG